jgi:hypothetical protein
MPDPCRLNFGGLLVAKPYQLAKFTRMSSRRAYHYSKQAEECRRYAEGAKRDDDRESWLRLAEKWQRIAEECDPGIRQAQQPEATEKEFSVENEGCRFDSN